MGKPLLPDELWESIKKHLPLEKVKTQGRASAPSRSAGIDRNPVCCSHRDGSTPLRFSNLLRLGLPHLDLTEYTHLPGAQAQIRRNEPDGIKSLDSRLARE